MWLLDMLKNATWLFAIAVIILAVFLPSYTQMQDLKQKNKDYEEKIKVLIKKNAQLSEERHLLEHDPVYLEKVAREKMGLIREGEVVYKLVPSNQQNKK